MELFQTSSMDAINELRLMLNVKRLQYQLVKETIFRLNLGTAPLL
jgi:hypothetical protein